MTVLTPSNPLTATTLEPALQALVDARLDTIDRMLLGRLPRADRMGILRDVEAQIEELISQKDPATLGREDILEVLGQLDPPESYLPEWLPMGGMGNMEMPPGTPAASGANPVKLPAGANRKGGKNAWIGGAMGLCSLTSILLIGPMIILIGVTLFPYILFMLPVFGIVCFSLGTAGLVQGIKNYGRGAWPVVAIGSGALSLFLSLVLQVPLLYLLILLLAS